MYGQIRQEITYKICKLCKILLAILQVEPANTITKYVAILGFTKN